MLVVNVFGICLQFEFGSFQQPLYFVVTAVGQLTVDHQIESLFEGEIVMSCRLFDLLFKCFDHAGDEK